ncbi:MAG: hypothetical protein WA672_15230 [Candidatus Angelobacter sp.]
MAVDLKAIDTRIRKLQKLRELLADDDTRELMADPEIMGFLRDSATQNGNGNGSKRSIEFSQEEPEQEPEPEESVLPAEGSLKRAVLDVARGCEDKFDNDYIVTKMKAAHYQFTASDPHVAVNQALRGLRKGKFIRIVRRGSGRMGHIYKAIREGEPSK